MKKLDQIDNEIEKLVRHGINGDQIAHFLQMDRGLTRSDALQILKKFGFPNLREDLYRYSVPISPNPEGLTVGGFVYDLHQIASNEKISFKDAGSLIHYNRSEILQLLKSE